MLSEMAQFYQKETGKQAWTCISGNDAENESEIHAYIEGPSNEYMNWLEDRASKSGDPKNSTASPVQHTKSEISLLAISSKKYLAGYGATLKYEGFEAAYDLLEKIAKLPDIC